MNKIKELRLSRGMTTIDLAKIVGCNNSYICDIENGIIRNPSLDKLDSIANALGVSVNDLKHDPSKSKNVRFKNNLKSIRICMRLTQKDMASLLGVSESSYKNWESGCRKPNVHTAIKISEKLKIPFSDIFGCNIDDIKELEKIILFNLSSKPVNGKSDDYNEGFKDCLNYILNLIRL